MRRKNLFFTIILIFLLVLLDGLGLPLKHSKLNNISQEESITMTGKVMSAEPRKSGGYKMEVRLTEAGGNQIQPGEKILLVYKEELDEPWQVFRKTITFQGKLKVPQGRRNPGCFDYRRYLLSQGIFYQSETYSFYTDENAMTAADRMASWLIGLRFRFTGKLGDEARGLVAGVLFGDTSALDEQVYDEFRSNGTAHVLAVSGLHVGILYGIYKKIFGHKQTVFSVVVLMMLLASYGTVSMWSPSVVRASLMIGLHVTAQLLDFRYDMITGLCTVALVLMVRNPYIIFSAGFQMSFLAIASICFLTRVLSSWMPDGMATALAVNLGLQLYQVYQFNYISLVSLIVNVPIIYLTGILVPAALVSFVLFAVTGSLPELCSLLLDSLSFLTVSLNSFSALGGRGSIDVISPPLWAVLAGYFLLFFLASEQNLVLCLRRRYLTLSSILCTGICLCIVISSLWYCPVSDDAVVFVDVGQGDCIHIRAGNRDVLIDGGGSTGYNTGKGTLKPYLLKNGAWNVDMAIATHEHMDHYKGLNELAEVYPVKTLKTGLVAGDIISITDSVWIETLWPCSVDPEVGQEENRNCSVFMVHYDEFRILITGDLDETGELEMLKHYEAKGKINRLKADILKVGHHGSSTSTSDKFLETVNPRIAVFQVGAYNIYGHPDQKIVEKCQKNGIMVKRNDYNGGIGFSFYENQISVHTVIP